MVPFSFGGHDLIPSGDGALFWPDYGRMENYPTIWDACEVPYRDDSRAVSVEAPAYDIFRALYGRRSYEQAAAWRWSGPSAPYIGAGLPFPFRWAESALVD